MDDLRSRAVGTYLWSGGAGYPSADEQAVTDEFGAEAAAILLPYLKGLVDEMNHVPVDWSVHTLASGAEVYADHVRRNHPELSEEAVIQLRNAYSYWWK
jgi:hypothetical protein